MVCIETEDERLKTRWDMIYEVSWQVPWLTCVDKGCLDVYEEGSMRQARFVVLRDVGRVRCTIMNVEKWQSPF